MIVRWVGVLAAICVASSLPVSASTLFASHEPIEVTLVGALDDLLGDARRGGTEEFPFALKIGAQDVEVKVRARGKSRRKSCNFPPLRMDVGKKSADGTPFDGENKLKLVTHCGEGERHGQNLLEEYAIYRMLNEITPSSFRVRLLRIRYQQSGKGAGEAHDAFLIEDDDALARRLGGTPLDVGQVSRAELDGPYSTTMALFQFMIANFDWSQVVGPEGDDCCHNGQPVRIGDRVRVVPYDFDVAGIISPSYAKPNPEFGMRRVRDRVFRGFCADQATLDASLAELRGARDALIATYDSIPGLSAKERDDQVAYLRSFFDLIDDPRVVQNQIVRKCRA